MTGVDATPPAGAERLMRLRVRLRPHLRVHRHEYRGQPWYVIEDPASGRAHRIDPAAREVLALLDGERTLEQVRAEALRRLGEEAPTAEELVALVAALYRADLASADSRPDLEELAARGRLLRRMRLRQYFLNPLALRFPLLDPDRFLARIARAIAPVPSAAWTAGWLLVVATGAAIAASNWPALSNGFVDRVFATQNLLVLWLCYPVVKLLHEFGHGVVIRRLGGQVHEMGVMLLVLVPIPYVEASAAAAFPSKRARMLVGAAGVLTELFLAGAALIVWALVEQGSVRAVCFNVALIAGISTLLFNGNPLMRFDGYYVFADWLEIPNLGQRANAYLGYLLQRHAFGLHDAQSPAVAPGEARWLLGYGIAAFCYRLFISVGIVLLVASQYFFIGVLLALWAVATMLVRPVAMGALYLAKSPALAGQRRRALGATLGALGFAALFLFAVPAPQWTRAEGVVWVPEQAQLRATSGCWVRAVVAVPGGRVKAGDRLIECEDPELATEVRVLEAQLAELRARDMAYFVASRLSLDLVREEIAHTEAKLADARRRLAGLSLLSPRDGRFVMEQPLDAPGRYARRGELLAYVVEDGPGTVRAVVEQDDADLVRGATRAVAIRPADRVGETIPVRIRREIPGASERLPSMALAVPGGGSFGIDPRGSNDVDADKPRVLTPVFLFDLEVPAQMRPESLGLRVYVRFEHEPLPIGQQAWRAARRLLLRRFEV
jgi:putative peptide zinc metalloprotease protein